MTYSWFILLLAIAVTALLMLVTQGTSLGQAIHERIPDKPRRRLFVASVSFFLTFAGVRAVVFAVLHQIPPFHFIESGGRHIHHLVFGIIILLLVGYGWLADIGTGEDDSSILLSRLMSILYGVGAALTLDECALAESARRLLVAPGSIQHRRHLPVRRAPLRQHLGLSLVQAKVRGV
jgi:hypothetical protein